MLQRVQVPDTSQHQLFRGDSVDQAIMVKLLQERTIEEDQEEMEISGNLCFSLMSKNGGFLVSTTVFPVKVNELYLHVWFFMLPSCGRCLYGQNVPTHDILPSITTLAGP